MARKNLPLTDTQIKVT